ncbi:MAG: glycerophosphodiester phosphodiesterase family protein [Eubacteriaceae bacterium]
MKKSLLEIIKFEIFFKIFVLFILSPLMNMALHFYFSKIGMVFNAQILYSLLRPSGILLIIILLTIAFVCIYFEIAVIILIINKNIRNLDCTLSDVMDKAFSETTHLFRRGNWKAALFFLLLIPFVHTGYVDSLIPRLTVPSFIIESLKQSWWGICLILLLYGYVFYLELRLIFVPVAMVLEETGYKRASELNDKWYHRLPTSQLLLLLGMFLLWYFGDTAVMNTIQEGVLKNSDISFKLFKYMVLSSSYIRDLGYWILFRLLQISMMTCFIYTMESVLYCNGRLPNLDYSLTPDILPGSRLNTGNSTILSWDRSMIWCKEKYKKFWRSRKHKWAYYTGLGLVILFFVIVLSVNLPLVHKPWVIGHRCTSTEVENTTEAVTAGAAQGDDFGELDVQLTADGELVVFHDESLRRLTGVDAEVGDLTLEEIQQLTLYENGKTAKIPTLAEMIEAAKATPEQIGLLIELKPTNGNDKEMADKVIKVVEDENFGDKAIFMSFSLTSMQALQQVHPEWWIGYTAYGTAGTLDESIWNYDVDFLALEESDISYSLLSMARENEIPIYVWTVESQESAKKYYEMGVSAVITNYPWEAKQARDNYLSKGYHTYEYEGDGYPHGYDYYSEYEQYNLPYDTSTS